MRTRINLTLSILLGISTLFLTSCEKERCPKANGRMVTEVRKLDHFSKIDVYGTGEVYLIQVSDELDESIEIEASSNIMDRITTEVRNGRLEIDNECINGTGRMIFTIRVKDLSKMHVSGSANVTTVTSFTTNFIDLQISGSGDMDFNLAATEVTCGISGSGNIDLAGQARVLDATISGSGDIHAFDFPVNDCYISISGSGNSEVFVNGTLDVDISGSGNVIYDGFPTRFNVHTSGSGVVKKR